MKQERIESDALFPIFLPLCDVRALWNGFAIRLLSLTVNLNADEVIVVGYSLHFLYSSGLD